MNYDVTYFIRKFEAIPEHLWTTEKFSEKKNIFSKRKCCAQGHCLPTYILKHTEKYKQLVLNLPKTQSDLAEVYALKKLFDDESDYKKIALINNGRDEKYKQPTPKQRILAALYDIKAIQEGQNQQPKEGQEGKIKEVIRYVSVPDSVKVQSKELILS